MERTLNIEAIKKINQEVLLKGWIRVIRRHGKLVFFDLRDRTGIVQCVANCRNEARLVPSVEKIKPEYAIEVIGVVNKRPEKSINPNLPTGTVEIEVKDLKILAEAEVLPFDMGADDLNLQLETLLDNRTISLRHPKIAAIFKVQETIVQSFRATLKNLGFTEIQAPTIVPSATEGGANVFKLKYYEYDAFLGQSPQLYKQIMVSVFERVFTVAHAYRAEPSMTTRHLSEYIGLDAEMGFINDFHEIMEVIKHVIKNIVEDLKERNKEELKLYEAKLPEIPEKIPEIKLKEAQKVIFQRTGIDHTAEPDLDPEDEREICRFAKEKYHSDVIFVTHYPTSKRPFYTYPDPENPEFTNGFDLIGMGLEWVTGGQRINDYKMLLDHIKKWGNKPEDFEMFLQAFRYGMPPEGGFCLGLERITAYILGLKNVKEASLYPRDMERVDIKLARRSVIPASQRSAGLTPAGIQTKSILQRIIDLLEKNNIKYKLTEHEEVKTSEEAAKIRGTDLKTGAKAMVLRGDEKYYLAVLPADQKIDWKKVREVLKVKKINFATLEETEKITGLKTGAIPPFGNILGFPTIFDERIKENEESNFNAGSRAHSISMKTKDLINLVKPQIAEIS